MNKPVSHEGFVRPVEPINEPTDVGPQQSVVDVGVEELPQEAAEQWPVKVRLLHKPVRGLKGEMLQELSFREPTGGDVNRYGNPCHINQEGDVVILERKMTSMMSVLSGILPPFIETMDPRDWNSCAYRLRGFFLPDPASW